MDAGYHKILPDGVRWGGLDPEGNQFTLDFPAFAADPIAGFDHDTFVWMDLIPYGDDPKDDRKYRSHLGKLVTKTVNKIVAIPVVKDHGSAGVTGALKNMSHGTVNNVYRSHSTPVHQRLQPVHSADGQVTRSSVKSSSCKSWTASARSTRGDRSRREDGKWTWENNAILFATDPVALDHVEWDIVDAQRAKMNLPPVAATGAKAIDPSKTEGFDVRQPQHIALGRSARDWATSTSNRRRAGGSRSSITLLACNHCRQATLKRLPAGACAGPAAGCRTRRRRRRFHRLEHLDHPQELAVGRQDQPRLSLEGLLVDLEGAGEVVELAGFADGLGVGVDDLGVDAPFQDVGFLLPLSLDLLRPRLSSC